MTMRIFIGFDAVEEAAYHTLVSSIIEHASQDVAITPLKQSMLREIYYRDRDPRQSNEFSFTRFLVPYLSGYEGVSLFMDCDMLFTRDPLELFANMDPNKAVMVCKHDYEPATETKYLGATQHKYPRKNWSSVMLFNNAQCKWLSPENVNSSEASKLHQFKWLGDEQIGELPLEWNWLVGEYPMELMDGAVPGNIHWTIGGPYFREYWDQDYADLWARQYLHRTTYVMQNDR